jgi:hypothetical protein
MFGKLRGKKRKRSVVKLKERKKDRKKKERKRKKEKRKCPISIGFSQLGVNKEK